MRAGPPFFQPFYDIGKLLIKETCVPAGGSIGLFLLAPLIGFSAVTLASTILWRALLDPGATFVGDLIVLLYLLAMPPFAVILGAFASRNPLASLGGSREMKLMIAYELPFALAVLVPVIQVHSIRMGDILARCPRASSRSLSRSSVCRPSSRSCPSTCQKRRRS
jgi:NADH-quinone oxidoreductase subunit H